MKKHKARKQYLQYPLRKYIPDVVIVVFFIILFFWVMSKIRDAGW